MSSETCYMQSGGYCAIEKDKQTHRAYSTMTPQTGPSVDIGDRSSHYADEGCIHDYTGFLLPYLIKNLEFKCRGYMCYFDMTKLCHQ